MATKEYDRWKAMEAERYLKAAAGAKARIKALAASIAGIYDEMEGIRAIDYSATAVAGGAAGDGLVKLLADKDERMRECHRQAHELECRVRRAQHALGRMADQRYAALLERRYLGGASWADAAEALGYTPHWAYKHRDGALVCLYDAMADRDKVDLPSAL